MIKIKPIAFTMALAAFTIALTGCGKPAEVTNEKAVEVTTEAVAEKLLRFHLSLLKDSITLKFLMHQLQASLKFLSSSLFIAITVTTWKVSTCQKLKAT